MTGAVRPLRAVLGALAVAYLGTYVAVALLRLGYPFELEWMEGAVLQHVERVLHGLPLYLAPSLDFVALDYTPLYYFVGAGAARLLGVGFPALRLVSFLASLGSLALIACMVRRETRSAGHPPKAGPAVLAAGFFAASYRAGGAWLDIARPDSLCLFLMLAALAALRLDPRPVRGPLAAGALLALACLTKQPALFLAVPLLLHTLLTSPRRFGVLATVFVAILGAGCLALERASGGWFHFFAWDVALGHARTWKLLPLALVREPLNRFGLAFVLAGFYLSVRGAGRHPGARGYYGAAAAGLVLGSWSLVAYDVTYDNVLLPAFAALAILVGLAWHAAEEWAAESPSAPGRALLPIAALACAVQLVLLAYAPWRQLPAPADRLAGERLLERIRGLPGRVLVPSHGYLVERAGKPGHFHAMPFLDVARGRGPAADALLAELRHALRQGRWSYVVLDDRDLLAAEVRPWYVSRWRVFEDHDRPWMVTGYDIRPDSLAVPRRP